MTSASQMNPIKKTLYLVEYIDYRKMVTFDIVKRFQVSNFLDVNEVQTVISNIRKYIYQRYCQRYPVGHRCSYDEEIGEEHVVLHYNEYVIGSRFSLVSYRCHEKEYAISLEVDDHFQTTEEREFMMEIDKPENHDTYFSYEKYYQKMTGQECPVDEKVLYRVTEQFVDEDETDTDDSVDHENPVDLLHSSSLEISDSRTIFDLAVLDDNSLKLGMNLLDSEDNSCLPVYNELKVNKVIPGIDKILDVEVHNPNNITSGLSNDSDVHTLPISLTEVGFGIPSQGLSKDDLSCVSTVTESVSTCNADLEEDAKTVIIDYSLDEEKPETSSIVIDPIIRQVLIDDMKETLKISNELTGLSKIPLALYSIKKAIKLIELGILDKKMLLTIHDKTKEFLGTGLLNEKQRVDCQDYSNKIMELASQIGWVLYN